MKFIADLDCSKDKTNLRLSEIAKVFLQLGITGFGGPAAHVALMQEHLVQRRKWINQSEFLDFVSLSSIIPGPNSTELAMHIGYKKAGYFGLVIAGLSFILPAFLIVLFLSWFYTSYNQLPELQNVFKGVTPVILAIICQALFNLSKSAIKNKTLGFLGIVALFMALNKISEIFILVLISASYLLLNLNSKNKIFMSFVFMMGFLISIPSKVFGYISEQSNYLAQNSEINIISLLFLLFFKIGSILFGSGYVLIAYIQAEFVEHYTLINQQQLIDAIAIGQFTPGPLFTTATFVGYLIHGPTGAIASTVGIFLPAFIFVALNTLFMNKLRQSKKISFVLDGLNTASLALMTVAGFFIAQSTLISKMSILIFCVSLVSLIKFKINSFYLILAMIGLSQL